MGFYIGYLCILHQVDIVYQLRDIANARGAMLPMEHHRKIEETEANVNRSGVPLRCNVWLHCHCCSMELHMFVCFMPLQCKARG